MKALYSIKKAMASIDAKKTLKVALSALVAVMIFIGGLNGIVPMKALNFEYVPPIENFPDTNGGIYVFGKYAPEWGGYHLAIDMRRPIDTPVYAVLDGTVVGSSYMQGFGDKNGPGGVIIIAHENKYGETFYALYGHLKDLEVTKGQTVTKGQRIAKVRDLVNDYGKSNPHLHFGINTVRASYAGYTSESNSAGFVDPYIYLEQNCTTFYCDLTVTAGKGGTVSGSGTYENGEMATITATPKEDYVFEGWYENGTKIEGATASYAYQVRAKQTLQAKFVPKTQLTSDGLDISGSLQCGDEVSFTFNTIGGISPYKYAMYVLKDGEILYRNYPSSSNTFVYKTQIEGDCTVVAYCIDDTGRKVSERKTITIS